MKVHVGLAGLAVFTLVSVQAGRLYAQGGTAPGGAVRGAPSTQPVQQPPAQDPLSAWLRQAYLGIRNRVTGFADKMPEENYGMRPGTKAEGRTFGQYVGHVANFSYLWCSQARGEKNPNAGIDLEKLTTKTELVKAVNEAMTYCDGAYSALTDASGTDIVDMTLENGQQTRNPRAALLILNYGHDNEVMGDLNTFMRIKDL